MTVFRFGPAAVLAAALVATLPPPAGAALSERELKCSASLAKAYGKMQTAILKTYARCHADDISGKADSPDACETLDAKAQEKVDKAKAKFAATVAKSCASVCSISDDVPCIADVFCPPRHTASPPNNSIAERCLGKGGSAPFDIRNLGWPGPYCEGILGHRLEEPEDLGECLTEVIDHTAGPADANVWDGLDESSGLDGDTLKCASSISKALQRALQRSYQAVAACRDEQGATNTPAMEPHRCEDSDADVIETVDEEVARLAASIDKACDDAQIADLPGLCSTGPDTPTTVAAAQACLEDYVREVATQERGFNRHVYAPIGMLSATHPDAAAPYCGDGLVSPKREEQTGVGEECDLGNDDACPGDCLPPGDVFQCTCSTTPRERFVVDGDAGGTDSDAGWKGASHDATHVDNYGYVTDLSNCNCDGVTQATCTGGSSDPVCDVYSNMAPRCTDDMDGPLTCDQRGNNDGVPADSDCFACDADSINAGTWCANGANANETLCQSQCFDDETDLPVMPQTPCLDQGDCGEGQTCRGRCDNTLRCNTMTEGAPLPQVSAAISVCITLQYLEDITGTKNIETGETSIGYMTRNNIQLGALFTQPCPVCGGSCIGGADDGDPCFGRCNASGDTCLVDDDCTGMGDTTCEESAADCSGGYCSLDLRCNGGDNHGGLCRPVAATPLGVVSNDCPPPASAYLSGSGVLQLFDEVTTGVVQHVPSIPCTAPGWDNYLCPCPADVGPTTGVPTRPSGCAAACNGGVNYGKGCATGNGDSGSFTKCAGGSESGAICDEDADCSGGGTCTANPTQCTAGVAGAIGDPCVTNGDCGMGGLCEDACPGAKCVPLCFQEGACNGGGRDGDPCATDRDCRECTAGNPSLIGDPCTSDSFCNSSAGSGDGVCSVAGGVTCDLADPEDGLCPAGPLKYRCTGAGYTTLPCELDLGTCQASTCTSGHPSKLGSPCVIAADCLVDNVPVDKRCENGDDGIPGNSDDIPGAGHCEPRTEDCFYNDGYAEGGTTLNGGGSPSDVSLNSVFCTPPSDGNPTINDVSGFGGPARTRRNGQAFINVPSFP